MAIEEQLTETLTQAIRAKDPRTSAVVRMLKTRLQERRTAKGFSGTVDDALVLDVIGAYRKTLQKALAEYEKRFLPKGMDDAAVRALVAERIKTLGIADAKQVGRLVGDIMKTHKGQVEAGDVKRIAEELLR
ncbi:MAG: GatB/YqeY domain-containing protein [Candidatus Rokubacteria bacterium]|nr:GatB/YqeY domain-containing protein [Candidatus Rokubacteria bacterium]